MQNLYLLSLVISLVAYLFFSIPFVFVWFVLRARTPKVKVDKAAPISPEFIVQRISWVKMMVKLLLITGLVLAVIAIPVMFSLSILGSGMSGNTAASSFITVLQMVGAFVGVYVFNTLIFVPSNYFSIRKLKKDSLT